MARDTTIDRRSLLIASGGLAAGVALAGRAGAQATPSASPVTGEWSFTDVTGKTVTLPQRPTKIAAYINQAASLWDFGIEAETVFGWTAANFPEGDHVAWGSVDVAAVEQISNIEGNVELEKLVAAAPDLIVTWTWNKDDPDNATNGFPPEVLEQVNAIAPYIILNQGDPCDEELARVEELAIALGANLEAPELTEQRNSLDAKIAELDAVLAEKPEITAIFASYGVSGIYYVASPDYVADVGYVRKLGLPLANDGSPTATQYWEELSTEEALRYPSDLVYLDAYGAWDTLEEAQADATVGLHPAIAAGQVGFWQRDFPLSYQGLAGYLEAILTPLRTAEKVS